MSPKSTNTPAISDDLVMSKIYTVRGYKVMLDRDLAALYGVPSTALKQTVRNNMERYPENFNAEMNPEELEQWRAQIVTSDSGAKMGLRYARSASQSMACSCSPVC